MAELLDPGATQVTAPLAYEPARAGPRSPTMQEVLSTDSRPVPPVLLEQSAVFLGDEDIDVTRYFSRAFHDLEMEHVWKRVWQMACRERDIPEPGDHILYDIGKEQLIVVRTQDGGIRAFPNACLHRGTQLRTCAGKVDRFRCPFHGFTWSLEGELIARPAAWDFPHATKDSFRMPEIRVETWGGFVFICLSDETESLESYLEILPAHFARWPLEDRIKAAHVAKIIPCNWKVAMEAFLEGYHIPATHPQTMSYSGDSNAQYDVWPGVRHVNRVLAWFGASNPASAGPGGEQKMLEAMMREMPVTGTPGELQLEEGQTAREALAERFRTVLSRSSGMDLSEASDAEMLDSLQYYLFPNFVPWSGLGAPLMYRWRPNGDDPETCLFEVMYLFVRAPDAPPAKDAPLRMLGEDQTFAHAPELGGLGPLLDQDLDNLQRIQKGLHALHKPGVTLANYQEVRIRHVHQTLDAYIAAGRARTHS